MELITLPSGGMIVKIPALMTARLSRNPFGYGILFSPFYRLFYCPSRVKILLKERGFTLIL
jgi:hypothetical protein